MGTGSENTHGLASRPLAPRPLPFSPDVGRTDSPALAGSAHASGSAPSPQLRLEDVCGARGITTSPLEGDLGKQVGQNRVVKMMTDGSQAFWNADRTPGCLKRFSTDPL